jgi:adhesin/invasin
VADGTDVLFETNLGSLGSLAVTKTTASGIAVATLTSEVPGVATLTATADSKVATTTVEFQPGPPDEVTLVANPTSLTVGEISALMATVKDQYDNDVADGTMVNLETNLGSLGSTTIDKPTVNGIVTATLTSQESGIATVTATADSKYDTASVTFNPDPPYTVTVEADPTSIPIGGFTSTITAIVEDQYGNPVADGTEVTFVANLGHLGSSDVAQVTLNGWVVITPLDEFNAQAEMLAQVVKTTVNGVAIATLTSGQTIGIVNISVFAGLAMGTTQVTFTVGAPHYVSVEASPDTIEVGGNTSTITAMVTDIGGNPVANGTPVEFTTDFGSLGSTTVTKYTTNGVATAILTSGLVPGIATVRATVDSKSDSVLVNIVPGPPSTIDMTANPPSIPIGGATSSIMATVSDRFGNNVADGTTVDFYCTLGSISPTSDTTLDGVAETTLTSGYDTGATRITAISGAATGWLDVVFTIGPPFYINVVANPTSIGLDGQTSNIQATVKDIGGNNVADGTEVTFVTSLGIFASDTIVKTTTSGVAEAVLTSETIAGTAVITATADSKYDTTEVVFNPDPPHAVTVTADPMAIPANGTSTSAVRATVTDQYDNMVADGVHCYFSTTLGSVSPASDTTLDGVAETTLTSSETSGLANVTATCAGIEDTTHVNFFEYSFRLYLPMIVKGY